MTPLTDIAVQDRAVRLPRNKTGDAASVSRTSPVHEWDWHDGLMQLGTERPETGIHVRAAERDDARGIAIVHVQAWREAYAGQLPADALAALAVEPRVPRWAAIIEDNVTDVYVAEAGEDIVGWATSSDGRDHDRPVTRELEGIYLLQAVHGSGAGQRLLDAAIGDHPAYLWMLKENPRAEAFYRRNGFERDGATRELRMAGAAVPTVRMVRRRG